VTTGDPVSLLADSPWCMAHKAATKAGFHPDSSAISFRRFFAKIIGVNRVNRFWRI
jgi:hypothetical protein